MDRLYHGFQLGGEDEDVFLFHWEHLEFMGVEISYQFRFVIEEEVALRLKNTSSEEDVEVIIPFEKIQKAYEVWKYDISKDAAYRLLSNVNHKLTPYLY